MGDTVVFIILGSFGCGEFTSLDISACWVKHNYSFAEIGQEESKHWEQLWKKWYRWLNRGKYPIEIVIHPQTSKKNQKKILEMIQKYKKVQIIQWSQQIEDVMYFGCVGKYKP